MYMERPRKVGIGPEAQSFGQSGREQQVILWSSETKVTALEEKPNPSGVPARKNREERGPSFSEEAAGKSHAKSRPSSEG